MELTANILSDNSAYRRKLVSIVLMTGISIVIASFLRISLLVLYPLIVLLIVYFYRFRISFSFILLAILVAISFLLSLFDNLFLKYKLLSLFYMLPFLLLLFSNPIAEKHPQINHFSIFFKCLAAIVFINDIVGLIQVIRNPYSDDSFIGIYSDYSISINGLMLLNAVLFYYYYACFTQQKKVVYLIYLLFFLSCAILGYYGAGLIVFIVAFIFSFFKLKITAVIKTATIGMASVAIILLFMYTVKPLVLEYNISNVRKILRFEEAGGARKMKSFYNYANSYPRNIKDLLFGSGPGTFNSRSAFMVGSPAYFQLFPFIKDENQPYYFKNYAYSLWNPNNTQKALYLDGFRNQPFSSILAFCGEYGIIFFLVFIWLYYRYFRHVTRLYNHVSNGRSGVEFRTFKFLMILLPLLLLIDNFYEYPEIMLLVLIGIKLAHASILQRKLNALDQ